VVFPALSSQPYQAADGSKKGFHYRYIICHYILRQPKPDQDTQDYLKPHFLPDVNALRTESYHKEQHHKGGTHRYKNGLNARYHIPRPASLKRIRGLPQKVKDKGNLVVPEPKRRLQKGKYLIPQLKNVHFKSPHFRFY